MNITLISLRFRQDDFLRLAPTRRGRQCIQPEICRNYNFGARVRNSE